MPPIKPSELVKDIPEIVFECFNKIITRNYNGTSSTVKQQEIVDMLVEKGLKKDEIFKKHWLDIEDHYRKAGWKVEFDKPGFNESGEAYFTFTKKGRK